MFGVGLVGIVLGNGHLGDRVGVRPPQLPVEGRFAAQRRRVGDVELAVLAVVRMERDAEQSLLVEEGLKLNELRLDVQERFGQQPAPRVDDAHQAVLLDHGLAAGAVGDRDHRQGMGQAAGDLLQFDFDLGIGRDGERQRSPRRRQQGR